MITKLCSKCKEVIHFLEHETEKICPKCNTVNFNFEKNEKN
jgi:predicted RNA-binding Zn-ribbon protein involved in translation (DUF1610 family)